MSKILKLFMMLLLTAACSPKDNREELTIIDSDGNKNVYKVELAQTKEELSTGLMNRTALDADSGMVFDLSDFNNVPTAMWMKDTKIALDMLFIDRDGMIYWIFENAEPDSVRRGSAGRKIKSILFFRDFPREPSFSGNFFNPRRRTDAGMPLDVPDARPAEGQA